MSIHAFFKTGIFWVVMILTISSCQIVDTKSIEGDGNLVTDTIALDHFQNIELGGMFNVTLISGNNPQVVIETDSNLMAIVNVYVREEILNINSRNDRVLRPTRMNITITYPELKQVSISGAGKISSPEPVESQELIFDISGAGEIDLNINTQILRTNLSGAGSLNLEGEADQHFANLSGANHLQSSNLITRETRIRLSGAGSAEVYASEIIDASLSGVGTIRYYGNPPQRKVTTAGIGTIKSGN